MKKLVICSLLIILCLTLAACNKSVEFSVNFVVDGEVYSTISTSGNEAISIPQNPEKDGYKFDGWFWDENVWQQPFTANSLLNVPLSSDMNVYAKWTEIDDTPTPLPTPTGTSTEISSTTLTVTGDKASLVVSNATETFSFLNDITVASNASYILAKDIGCENVVASKTVALSEGDNTFYVLVTNGSAQKLYTVTIRRRPIYNIQFNVNGGSTVVSQRVEEGNLATAPETTRIGYSFASWDYDFSMPVNQPLTINASWTPNANTAYKVEYYRENLSKNGYDLYETVNLAGTSDSIINATIKTFDHFSHTTDLGKLSGSIEADGSLVLKVYYTRNSYVVTTGLPQYAEGTITQGGTYAYGTEITISATWEDGFTYSGLFDNGNKLTEQSSFTFVVDKNYDIYANITPNDETPYTVEYYLENITKSGFDKVHTDILSGKTNTQAVADIKEYDHFTHDPHSSTTYGYIAGDGSLVLKIYYTRNSYTISTSINIGDITVGGTYPYGTEITLNATFPVGYYFNGFFENQEVICETATYTFMVDSNRTIKGSVKVCEDTPYKVEYYLENLSRTGYDLVDSYEDTGKTNSTVTARMKEYAHFTYDDTSSNVSGNLDGDGSRVLKLYYTRNMYTVSANIEGAGDIAIVGSYPYGTNLTLSKIIPNIGYSFDGWYVDSSCVASAQNVVITIDANIEARFNILPEMQNFLFTSTQSTCTITGIINQSITEIVVPDYVTMISEKAFSGCNSLEKLTIPFVGTSASATSYEKHFGAIFSYWKSKNADYTKPYAQSGSYYYFFTIPSSLVDVTVTGGAIGEKTFINCASIVNLTIADGVTDIGNYAFDGCDGLKTVIIGDRVKNIGTGAFAGAQSYTDVSMNNRSVLETVVIGSGVETIGSYAFWGCLQLQNVTIKEGVKVIGTCAFAECNKITTVELPNTITTIEYGAFMRCTKLETMVIPDSVTTVGTNVFSECIKLASVTLGAKMTSIGDSMFYGCVALTSVEIPDSVKSIGNMAFGNCSALRTVTVGSGLESIGAYAFSGSNISSFTLAITSGWYRTTNRTNWENKQNGTSSKPSASSLKSAYSDHYWYRV